jgi:hypothetical protein
MDLGTYLAEGTTVPLSDFPTINALSKQRRSSLIAEFETVTGVQVGRSSTGIAWTDRLLDLLDAARHEGKPLKQALPHVLSARALTCPGPPATTSDLTRLLADVQDRLHTIETRLNELPPQPEGWTDDEVVAYLHQLHPYQQLSAQIATLTEQVQPLLQAWQASHDDTAENDNLPAPTINPLRTWLSQVTTPLLTWLGR